MMEARLSALFKTADEYEILEKFKGETLKGKTYLPLFPYFAHVSDLSWSMQRIVRLKFVRIQTLIDFLVENFRIGSLPCIDGLVRH